MNAMTLRFALGHKKKSFNEKVKGEQREEKKQGGFFYCIAI